MKLLVRFQKDLPAGHKPAGIPDAWPAEVREVDDETTVPNGWMAMTDASELEAYKASIQEAYDAWRDVVDLPTLKEEKFAAIDKRTGELIEAGFLFGGKRHSLSQKAQTTYTGLYAVRAEPLLSYPVKVNTLDDSGSTLLGSAADVQAFYLTAVGTYRAYLDAGTALKDAVRAATTVAEVAAIADGR